VEQVEVTIARHWRGKNVSTVTNERTEVEEPLQALSPTRYVPRLYNEDQQDKLVNNEHK
jgi:hypothetical protein